MPQSSAKQPILIVFFDAQCPLCSHAIRFLLDRDGYNRLRFASLHNEDAKDFLRLHGLTPSPQALLVWNGTTWQRELQAVAEICQALPGIWKAGQLFAKLPMKVQHRLYQFVARRRYKWFGKYQTCRLPENQDRAKFINLRNLTGLGKSGTSDQPLG